MSVNLDKLIDIIIMEKIIASLGGGYSSCNVDIDSIVNQISDIIGQSKNDIVSAINAIPDNVVEQIRNSLQNCKIVSFDAYSQYYIVAPIEQYSYLPDTVDIYAGYSIEVTENQPQ